MTQFPKHEIVPYRAQFHAKFYPAVFLVCDRTHQVITGADQKKKERGGGGGAELSLDWDRSYLAAMIYCLRFKEEPPHPGTASWVLSEYCSCYSSPC